MSKKGADPSFFTSPSQIKKIESLKIYLFERESMGELDYETIQTSAG
jgi:hypothetical protein